MVCSTDDYANNNFANPGSKYYRKNNKKRRLP
jgi:hypothetical protein